MVDAGTTLSRHPISSGGYGHRQTIGASSVTRLRKHLVIASLMVGDVAAVVATALIYRCMIELCGLPLLHDLPVPLCLVIPVFLCVGLYTGCGPSPYERFRLRTLAVAGYLAANVLIGFPAGGFGTLLVSSGCSAMALLIFGHYVELIVRTVLIRLNLWGAPTALVGCGENCRKLAHLLIRQPAIGLTPICFVESPLTQPVTEGVLPLPVIASGAEPGSVNQRVEFVVFDSPDELSAGLSSPPAWMSSCRHLLVKDVQDIQSLWIRTRMLGEAIGFEIRRDLRLKHNQLLKRALDVAIAIPIGLFLLPIIGLLALVIKVVNPGPAFYAHPRVGRNGVVLQTLKLRTMCVDSERRLQEHLKNNPQARAEWQRFYKLSNDPRVLPIIGNFMRRTSLDELPQLWNVIRGDMSLVGPRPFPSYHMSSFDEEFQTARMSVQPGITGMWQVSMRSDGDLHIQRAQDLFYIRNWSLWLDIYILLQTVPAVLSAKGAK
jgi:Undecaprenyl-phosphate galactose phosphotransferase WbaP